MEKILNIHSERFKELLDQEYAKGYARGRKEGESYQIEEVCEKDAEVYTEQDRADEFKTLAAVYAESLERIFAEPRNVLTQAHTSALKDLIADYHENWKNA